MFSGEVMNIFSRRLRQCRQAQHKSQKEIAVYLRISERAYQHYEAGTREPNLDMLVKISYCFNVSLDYLCGITDEPSRVMSL